MSPPPPSSSSFRRVQKCELLQSAGIRLSKLYSNLLLVQRRELSQITYVCIFDAHVYWLEPLHSEPELGCQSFIPSYSWFKGGNCHRLHMHVFLMLCILSGTITVYVFPCKSLYIMWMNNSFARERTWDRERIQWNKLVITSSRFHRLRKSVLRSQTELTVCKWTRSISAGVTSLRNKCLVNP